MEGDAKGSLNIIENGLTLFPGDPGLLETRDRIERTTASQAERERQLAGIVQRVKERAAKLSILRNELQEDLRALQTQAQRELDQYWRP